MNAFVFSIGYIVAVLVGCISSTDRLLSEITKTVNGPYNFTFLNLNEFILLEITLKNIPPSVETIFLIGSGKEYFRTKIPGLILEKLRVDKEIKYGQVTIPYPRNLKNYQHIFIEVELKTKEGLCSKSIAAEGRYASSSFWDVKTNQYIYWYTDWNYDSTGSCILPNNCEIVIDFNNECEEIFSCEYNATEYTCILHPEKLKNSQPYQLYQIYNSEPFIAVRLSTSGFKIKLIIELESFDNNTSVNVANPKNITDIIWSHKIMLTAKDVVKDNIVRTLNYSESIDIHFNCEKYTLHILPKQKLERLYKVLINTKENKIKQLFKVTKNKEKVRINMENNGSILCCIYYSYEWTNDGKDLQITRVVVNKTLLIYQPKEALSPNAENSADLARSNNYMWIVYVPVAIIGVSVLILALYFISKRGWLTSSQPVEETVGSDNMTQQNQVLYAELDLVKNENHQTRNPNEESHYANIIGELHPH